MTAEMAAISSSIIYSPSQPMTAEMAAISVVLSTAPHSPWLQKWPLLV